MAVDTKELPACLRPASRSAAKRDSEQALLADTLDEIVAHAVGQVLCYGSFLFSGVALETEGLVQWACLF